MKHKNLHSLARHEDGLRVSKLECHREVEELLLVLFRKEYKGQFTLLLQDLLLVHYLHVVLVDA
jgi:hypothetical protein